MKRCKGFTVIELVVAITIVCLLVAVAFASFQDHMTRKARAEARRAMIEVAEWLQIQHAKSGTYLVKPPITQTPADGDAEFRIGLAAKAVSASDPKAEFPATTADTFTLQAVPTGQDACGALLLDSAGRTGVTGVDAQVADCWK
jgi:type IV pilus assembly protein PilE